ncbi:MAG TPA: outer membrane beta-barrel protein [Lacipirellulaceae bacterium]|nr:outer membrane beta-barrel protein [Lacipirellulaceae bacterium]
MKTISLVGLAGAATLAAAVVATPVIAGDFGRHKGGYKDFAAPVHHAPVAVGNCYFRGDVGYSWARSPSARWPVSTIEYAYDYTDPANPVRDHANDVYTYEGDAVTNTRLSNTAFGGIGLGCGSGSKGIRGEFMLNQYGWRKFYGEPMQFLIIDPEGPGSDNEEDPVHTRIRSTTAMFNAYFDLGKMGRIVPYVGAGVGIAYNKTSEAYFTQNAYLTNRIQGGSRLSLAWSLMAGVGVQLSDRAILDVGYRYTDLGKAETGRIDNAGFVNPAVKFDDLRNHEIRVGLRYHFGHSHSAPAHQTNWK